MKKPVIIIAGPTAVGKTDISIGLAKALDAEIVSADSMQIYKYLDIGSAKVTPEEMQGIEHYLIDEIDPREDFSVSKYRELAFKYIDTIHSKGKIPIIAGGTGLYVNSLLYEMNFAKVESDDTLRKELEELLKEKGPKHLHEMLEELDPSAAERIHMNNTRKVIRAIEICKLGGVSKDFKNDLKPTEGYDFILVGLNRDRQELYDRINLRVELMLEAGLIDEVKSLMSMGLKVEDISMKGIGYKEIIDHLNGKYDFNTAIETLKRNTRRYAKRQLTWFRRYENMQWFTIDSSTDKNKIIDDIVKFIKGKFEFM